MYIFSTIIKMFVLILVFIVHNVSVGWLPVYNDSRDQRPQKASRLGRVDFNAKLHLYQQRWTEFLDGWVELTKDCVTIPLAY